MNYKIVSTLLFTAGVVVGSVATWKFVKTKYERLAQEEIESVKEACSKNYESSGNEDSDESDEIQNEDDDSDENGAPVEGEDEDPQDYMRRLAE